jgi:hypothetical protein
MFCLLPWHRLLSSDSALAEGESQKRSNFDSTARLARTFWLSLLFELGGPCSDRDGDGTCSAGGGRSGTVERVASVVEGFN